MNLAESRAGHIGGTVNSNQVLNSKFGLNLSNSFIYMGVDGCPAGWFCVELDGSGRWRIGILESAAELLEKVTGKRRVLIDIPIGLLEEGGPHRLCDKQARRLLGRPRASSVFPVPTRQAVYAKSYPEAVAVNRKRLGRGLSKQTWNINGKIQQLDQLLQTLPSLRKIIRESHPEICWWSLNGKRAMGFNKKQPEGFAERLTLLKHYSSTATNIVDAALEQYPRKHLARDDILDALVLALSATFNMDNLKTLPIRPPLDPCGIRMEMVYADPDNSSQ